MSNSISFIGNLGGDAELKQVGENTVLEFSVGDSTGFGDRKVTNWLRCGLWGTRGSKIAEYLTKGTKVFVSGELTLRPWTTSEGVERISPDVNVHSIDFAGGKQDSPQAQQAPAQEQKSTTMANLSEPADQGDLPF